MATFSKGGLTFRPATVEDYDAVMAIDENIYGGYDYLPFKYMEMIRDPTHISFVCVKDGKVIAFSSGRVVDGGESVLGQAARVSQGFRSKGYWNRLRAHVMLATYRAFPNLKHIVFASTDKQANLDTIKKHPDMRFLMEQHMFRIALPEDLKGQEKLKELCVPDILTRLSKTATKKAMLDPENTWKLFPHRRLTVEWQPYRLVENSVNLIVDSVTEIVCRKSTEEHANPNECLSISIAQAQQLKKTFGYYVSIYSILEEDIMLHVHAHLSLIWNHVGDNKHVAIYFFLPVHFDDVMFADKLKARFGLQGTQACAYTFDGKLHEAKLIMMASL